MRSASCHRSATRGGSKRRAAARGRVPLPRELGLGLHALPQGGSDDPRVSPLAAARAPRGTRREERGPGTRAADRRARVQRRVRRWTARVPLLDALPSLDFYGELRPELVQSIEIRKLFGREIDL